jgi:hypothetical protein
VSEDIALATEVKRIDIIGLCRWVVVVVSLGCRLVVVGWCRLGWFLALVVVFVVTPVGLGW